MATATTASSARRCVTSSPSNVHGPHDSNFWALCRQIEREVLSGDWKSGGRTVGDEAFAPSTEDGEDEDFMDHGGWTGGEFVLGSSGSAREGTGSTEGLSRREILARAAEQRMKDLQKAAQVKKGPDQSPRGGGEA